MLLSVVCRGYEQLFDLAAFREDPWQLYEQMGNQHGAEDCRFGWDTLAAYVFTRLWQDSRVGELLGLPDDFNEELYCWLQHQVSLL